VTPAWLDVVVLALKLNRLPSEILEEDAIWIERMSEVLYHLAKQDLKLNG